jgi:hypothetical protein
LWVFPNLATRWQRAHLELTNNKEYLYVVFSEKYSIAYIYISISKGGGGGRGIERERALKGENVQ